MGSIKDKVAVVGMGCTGFGELWNKSFEDLAVEATSEALTDAGIESKDIQAAWLGSVHHETGVSLSHSLRLPYIPVTRVENRCCTGTDAFRNACYAVAAGVYDVVLSVGAEKLKDSGFMGSVAGKDDRHPIYHSGSGGSAPGIFALRANRYFHHYGLDPLEGKRALASIMVKNHHNGSLCPKAHYRREITLEQVMNAPIIAYPLGLFDCCGNSDGAAAAIICRADMAKSFRADPIFVKGLGIACGLGEDYGKDSFDLVHFEETVVASRAAYSEAGITDPSRELGLAEVHDCFSITEAITYEDLGLCGRGEARERIADGYFELSGQLPVNADGGLKCFGHPLGASGLRMIYEVYKQLQGRADLPARQLRNVELGLTHNLGGGMASWVCAVSILGH